MKAAEKSATVSAFAFILTILAASVSTHPSPALAGQGSDVAKFRSMAESQHEIVVLLLGKKEFAQALAEANKIFEMKWPDDQEPLLLSELMKLSDKFLHEQASYGLQLLDANQRRFKSVASQIAIWKEKGYMHKKLNEPDKALECFNQALKLEKSRTP